MSSAAESVLGDVLLSDLSMKTTTSNRQTIPHISYIHIHIVGYKIKSLTLLKQINFTKETHAKLAGNSVLSPSVAVMHSAVILSYWYCIKGCFVSSMRRVKVNLG